MPSQLGKYTVLGVLGSGASSTVYLARDEELQRTLAIKQLAPDLAAHPGFVEAFRQEAEIMARIEHPNCVRVFDLLEIGPAIYIVSEYVDGSSLRRILEQALKLTPEQALGVTGGALRGLAHAHELGLVHRDVKPENLLADRAGISKLADFGQAFFTGETGGGPRQATGSPAYMSPEQVRGDQGDVRSDVYAAGSVLYEFMAGRPPFIAISRLAVMKMQLERDPPELSRVNPRIPPRLSAVVGQALEKEPQDRFQTAGQFLAALEEAAEQAYGRDWILSASIAGLVAETAAAAAAASAGAAASAQAGAGEVASASVPVAPAPPAPQPPAPVPVTEKVAAEPERADVPPGPLVEQAAAHEPATEEVAMPAPGRRGVVVAILAGLAGLVLGATVAYIDPTLVAAPAVSPSPSPTPAATAAALSISAVSAHFDEARSTTVYQVEGGATGTTYTWGWVKNPGCGSLQADPGGLTAGYAHNGCNQVLEAGGTVGVCASGPGGATLFQRNARFGDGSLSAADAAAAGVSGDQFSRVTDSGATGFCSTVFTPAMAATVTPLPVAASPQAASASPTAATQPGPLGQSGQVPGLVGLVVVGILIAGLGVILVRRGGAPQ